MPSKSSRGSPVWVNVYDMFSPNKYIYPIGLGIYHSGIEVYGIEYAFGGHDQDCSGIYQMTPKVGIPGIALRTSIHLGDTNLTSEEVSELIYKLSKEFTGTSYNIMTRNCNHFSDFFSNELCNKRIPGWINRLAKIGTYLPCTMVQDSEWISSSKGPSLNNTS